MDKVDKSLRELIVLKIIEKKELEYLNKDFIEKSLALFILENKSTYTKLKEKFLKNEEKSSKAKELKIIVKGVRSRLRELFGVFYIRGFENAEQLISSITSENMEKVAFELLKTHRSSKERLRYHEEIYDKIAQITNIKPQLILDLACGYNPFSYFFLKESFQCSPDYICCDLSSKDIILFNKFFQNAGIKGESFYCDLTSDISIPKKVKADICFLFKTLDSLESASKNSSDRILKEINTKYFIVSFPTKSIGGNKQILKSKRAWFYKLLDRLSYTYEEFSIHNELFFVIKK
jgi:16S rRNA (guanine(1405)-N(7))-methyltransferase